MNKELRLLALIGYSSSIHQPGSGIILPEIKAAAFQLGITCPGHRDVAFAAYNASQMSVALKINVILIRFHLSSFPLRFIA